MSPECQTSFIHGGSPAEVVDQTTLYSQRHLQHQSFMPSPPYTPYNHSPTNPGDVQQFPMSSAAYESNGSSYYSNGSIVMNGIPLNSYKMRRSLSPSESSNDGGQYGATSPPYSATSVPQTLPIVAGPVPTTHSQAQAFNQPRHPVVFGYSDPTFAPTSVVNSAPPQLVAMSVGTPSPSVEMSGMFYAHGSAVTYQPSEIMNPAGPNLTDLQFVNESPMMGTNFTAASVPQPHVRQTVINVARARYSGVMPSGGHTGHIGGSARTQGGGGDDREASESISQWSQWLKSGAPAGPAPPVY